MKQPAWPRLGLALLMGALVGPYWALLIDPDWQSPAHPAGLRLAIVISTLTVTLLASASALLNGKVRQRGATLASVFGPAFALIGFVTLNTLDPVIWQGYASEANFISLLAILVATPAAAAFASCAMPPSKEARPAFDSRAVLYALVAWLGIGVQNLALPYLVPVAESIWYIAAHHSVGPHGGAFSINPIIIVVVVIIATAIWVIGFGLAAIEGIAVAMLLSRPVRRPAYSG